MKMRVVITEMMQFFKVSSALARKITVYHEWYGVWMKCAPSFRVLQNHKSFLPKPPLHPHPWRKPSMDMHAKPKVNIDFDITCKICGQVALACAKSQRRKKCRIVWWTSTTTKNFSVKMCLQGFAVNTLTVTFQLYNKQVWIVTRPPLQMVTLDVWLIKRRHGET